MLRKWHKFLLGLISVVSLPLISLTSCSFFKTNDTNTLINSFVCEQLEDGNLQLTITFDDPEQEPMVFIVSQGKLGNGIESISQVKDEFNSEIDITITYTDENIDPITFSIEEGVYILSINETKNSDGLNTVNIILSNNEVLSFNIQKGLTGDDGVSIIGVTSIVNEDDTVILTIQYSNQTTSTIIIPPLPDGKEGAGIQSINVFKNDVTFTITVTYRNQDGTLDIKDHTLVVPRGWQSGQGNPNDNNVIGSEGDYYFNISSYSIYRYTNNRWELIISLDNTNKITHKVSFDLNASSDASAKLIGNNQYEIPNGSSLNNLGYVLPSAIRDNYEFMGWYTSNEYNPTVGQFTNNTPVYSDIILYARWSIVE